MAAILGIFFWGQELDERGVMNINGALFLYLLNLSMQNAFAVVNVSLWKDNVYPVLTFKRI